MTLAAQPSLFLGTTPAPARDYLQRVFASARGKYPRVVVPCAGRFSGPLMALRAGYRPDQIAASDISLFSSLIGYLAAGKPLADLAVTVNLPDFPELSELGTAGKDPLRQAAAIMLAQKLATMKARNAYTAMIAEDLRRGWQRHLAAIQVDLAKLVGQLKGLRYDVGDVFGVVEHAAADPSALLYVDPPGFTGGYKRMFDTKGVVTWQEPSAAEFSPKTGFDTLKAALKGTPALALTLRAGLSLGDHKHEATFAQVAGRQLIYILANRPPEVLGLAGGIQVKVKYETLPTPGYPVWGDADDRVRPDSVVRFTMVKREIGLYYRDLFAHALGSTDTELFLLMWLDGKVFGTVGMHLQKNRIGQSEYAFESFGFSARHDGYKHLNRLLMQCLVCHEFLDVLKATTTIQLTEPRGIRTACISRGHEVKTNRGIMKLVSREQRPDGRFHLLYQQDWKAGTFADQVASWAKKYGAVEAPAHA